MIRLALAQMNQTVGDLDGNAAAIAAAIDRAKAEGAQVLAVPELAVTGYPPEDLLLRWTFVQANKRVTEELATRTGDLLTVIGFVDERDGLLYNAAAICHGGRIVDVYHKHLLPNYGVFDEDRYFTEGRGHVLIETQTGIIGVCVCEDAWSPTGPIASQGDAGAQVIVNINASPFHKGKLVERAEMLGERARRAKSSIAYVNMTGGQDELVFDGGSIVLAPDGRVVSRLAQFEESFGIFDVPLGEARAGHGGDVRRIQLTLRDGPATAPPPSPPTLGREEEIYRALCLGVGDYVRKNGFEKVVVGLSGGIDSALTAAIAVDALGPAAVLGITMPSRFSSSGSVDHSKELAANLGIQMHEIAIADVYETFLSSLETAFGSHEMGVAEENLQARIRGTLLMTVSNRYGHLLLATGNKSEMACGYATLYGDMAGGFALLKDVFKLEVYALSHYRNSVGRVIPEEILTKAPSAELRPDQKDSDSLPSYEVLDPILQAYIEEDAGIDDIVADGYDRAAVERVVALVDRAEYKRRQAAPGPKVTTKAFGRDRRLPITNRWREGGPQTFPDKVVGEKGPS